MTLDNKLNIKNQVELAKAEEKISKQKAKQLFESGEMGEIEIGTFAGLAHIINICLTIFMTLQEKFVTLISPRVIFDLHHSCI